MGQMIKIVTEEIASLFSDHPLSFLNERDVVSEFHRRLLTQYPDILPDHGRSLKDFLVLWQRRFTALQPPYVSSNFYLVWAFSLTGKFERALHHGRRSVEAADASGSPTSQVPAHLFLAAAFANQGDFAEAGRHAQNAVTIGEATGVLSWLPAAYAMLGWAMGRCDQAAESIEFVQRAIDIQESLGIRVYVSWYNVRLAEALLLAGEGSRARDAVTRARDLAHLSIEEPVTAEALFVSAAISDAGSPQYLEQTKGEYSAALALSEELGMRPLVAHCHLGLGKLYGRTGDNQQAQEHLTTATTMYREMEMRFWLEQAEAQMKECT